MPERAVETVEIAASMAARSVTVLEPAPLLVYATGVAVLNAAVAMVSALSLVPALPRVADRTSAPLRSRAIVSPPLAPTWKLLLYDPLSRLVAPNFVWLAMLFSWVLSAPTSDWIALSDDWSWLPALPAWTTRVRMRCRMFCVVPRAPSAIWATLMPSCAFDTAWVRPLIWLDRPWLIDSPEASSAALLIRRPLDSRSNAEDCEAWFAARLLYAFSAATLVLMRRLIVCLPKQSPEMPARRATDPSVDRRLPYRRSVAEVEPSSRAFAQREQLTADGGHAQPLGERRTGADRAAVGGAHGGAVTATGRRRQRADRRLRRRAVASVHAGAQKVK